MKRRDFLKVLAAGVTVAVVPEIGAIVKELDKPGTIKVDLLPRSIKGDLSVDVRGTSAVYGECSQRTTAFAPLPYDDVSIKTWNTWYTGQLMNDNYMKMAEKKVFDLRDA